MDRAADEGIVHPAGIVYAVVGHGVVEDTLAFIHSEDGSTEFEGGVVSFAESDRERIADVEDIGGVGGKGIIIIGSIIETLFGCFLDVMPIGVVDLKDMCEGHEGDVVHFDGIAFDPSAVFDDLDGVVVLAFAGDGVLVVQVSAEVSVSGHGVEVDRQVFGPQG